MSGGIFMLLFVLNSQSRTTKHDQILLKAMKIVTKMSKKSPQKTIKKNLTKLDD